MKDFEKQLIKCIDEFKSVLSTPSGDWSVKGFIDVAKNIYTISVDTKVVSKIIELMMFPAILKFAKENDLNVEPSLEQNHYPDVTLTDKSENKFALDLKSTYRNSDTRVSGFTLGAFCGYFRDRNSNKNITYPYKEYSNHYILGVIYTKQEDLIDEQKVYSINDLPEILSVIKDFDFLVQEKYRIARDTPGSGNTKNIGSSANIDELKNGKGIFAEHGAKIFDDYWMNYMTNDMAVQGGLVKPAYSNIGEYLKYRNTKNI